MVRREVRFPGFCRESMVKKLFSLVVEHPSDCSAAPRTTLCLNSFCLNTLRLTTSAEQGFSFPIPVQATVTRMKGLQDCVRRDFNACSLNLSMEHGIDSLKPTCKACHAFCRRMVYGKSIRFSLEQKAMPADAGGLAPPLYSHNG